MSEKHILAVLDDLKKKHSRLTAEILLKVSEEKNIPLNDLYGVATFYSFLGIKPRGKYVIRLCNSTPCCMKGGGELLSALKDKLGITPGDITKDRKFSLELVNCIGACDKAPAMLINDKLYGDLTGEKIDKIIEGAK